MILDSEYFTKSRLALKTFLKHRIYSGSSWQCNNGLKVEEIIKGQFQSFHGKQSPVINVQNDDYKYQGNGNLCLKCCVWQGKALAQKAELAWLLNTEKETVKPWSFEY